MAAPQKSTIDEHLYAEPPDISHIVIEDDEPVDGVYAEKQHRLLVEPLYSSWSGPPSESGEARPFLATTNVGLFSSPHEPPLVPDAMLSVDVRAHEGCRTEKRHNTYFIWEFGKPPNVVVEVVSNTPGDELGKRLQGYNRMQVPYYVVWDPNRRLGGVELRAFELRGDQYVPMVPARFPTLGLELLPWVGTYEGMQDRWLRWHAGGEPIPTGAERAEAEAARAEAEAGRAEAEAARAERLAELLRRHGLLTDA